MRRYAKATAIRSPATLEAARATKPLKIIKTRLINSEKMSLKMIPGWAPYVPTSININNINKITCSNQSSNMLLLASLEFLIFLV
jgi:hypothetical protein